MHGQLTVAEANRRHYARIFEIYDGTEDCVVQTRLRARLEALLDRALAVSRRDHALRVLDACGGSGNASLMLLERGLAPTTVDISPEMLESFRAKARARGFEARTEVAEIAGFLAATKIEWDLIVFSSALHHLHDPVAVLLDAAGRLAPGGVIVTEFDPRRVGRAGTTIRRLDYYAHVLVHHPRAAMNALRRKASAKDDAVGMLAERHAVTGLDDGALLSALEEVGCSVVIHERYHEARLWPTRVLLGAWRLPTAFGIVIQAPS